MEGKSEKRVRKGRPAKKTKLEEPPKNHTGNSSMIALVGTGPRVGGEVVNASKLRSPSLRSSQTKVSVKVAVRGKTVKKGSEVKMQLRNRSPSNAPLREEETTQLEATTTEIATKTQRLTRSKKILEVKRSSTEAEKNSDFVEGNLKKINAALDENIRERFLENQVSEFETEEIAQMDDSVKNNTEVVEENEEEPKRTSRRSRKTIKNVKLGDNYIESLEFGGKRKTRRSLISDAQVSEPHDSPSIGPKSPSRSPSVRRDRGRKKRPQVEELVDEEEENRGGQESRSMDSVIKVFCVHTEPNFSLPWQKKRQYSSNSSGFLIAGRRILTNAHSVAHCTVVKVKKRGSDVKFLAQVLAVGTECDIAMLTVEEESFWENYSPLELGPLPHLQSAVTVVGYPIGGDSISVTSGVVSRIEVTAYAHGASELLGVQIDAAINSGNSGGPAFNSSGQCVGIAFQSLKNEDTENIGYIIPTPVIQHFISDFELNGKYTGFPHLGIESQKLESPSLRKACQMGPSQKGVLVRRIEPTAPAFKALKPSDILLTFDGVEVANDGTVPFRSGERISFSYLVSQKFTGETAKLEVLRGGKKKKLEVQLKPIQRLVPAHLGGELPRYYIVAGVLFTTVSVPYLRSEYGKDYDFEAPVKLLDKMVHCMAQDPNEEVVVAAQVLAADVNIGYEDIINTQVLAFNGAPIKSLKQLALLVENCKEQFMRFELEYDQLMVLDTTEAKKSTEEILATHNIPAAMSPGLLTS